MGDWLLLLAWLLLLTVLLYDVQLMLFTYKYRISSSTRQMWMATPALFAMATLLISPWRLWAAGVVVLALLLHLGAHLLWERRLARRLSPATLALQESVARLCREWCVALPDRILVGDLGPAVVRRTLVLPRDVPGEELPAILAHELAHLKARDPLKVWLVSLVGTLLGWHPLARPLLANLALELELEADRQAAAWLGDARAYGLTLGRWGLKGASESAYSTALAGRLGDLVLRLRALLDPSDPAVYAQGPGWATRMRPARPEQPGDNPRHSALARWLMPMVNVLYMGIFLLVVYLL